MRKLDEFSAKAHRQAVKKRFPQVEEAVFYEVEGDRDQKFAALRIHERERRLFTFYAFECLEHLVDLMDEGLENKTERMLSFYAGKEPTKDEVATKRDAIAMLNNPNDAFTLDDRRIFKGERHLEGLLERAKNDNRRAWLLLDQTSEHQRYEES